MHLAGQRDPAELDADDERVASDHALYKLMKHVVACLLVNGGWQSRQVSSVCSPESVRSYSS